jgi:hypothetical protein
MASIRRRELTAWLKSRTTETAVVDKPAEEADDHGHHHHH